MTEQTPLGAIESYLEQLACMQASQNFKGDPQFNYTSTEDFVLDRGEPQPESAPLTEEQLEYLLKVAGRCTGVPFEPKQCFQNAMVLTAADHEDRIWYVEGYCLSGAIPVHHAWVELDGKLVDLTRSLRGKEAVDEFMAGKPPQEDLLDRVLGEIPKGWMYLGIKFPVEAVRSYMFEHEETNALIGNYKLGFDIFKKERNTPRDRDVWDNLMSKAETA